MRNMSFAMTTEQVRLQAKTVTRRFGWWFLKAGDLVQPVEKGMGLQKGEKVKRIGVPIRIVSTRPERLLEITTEDCAREGFPHFATWQFVDMLCKHYKCTGTAICNRIEFEYTN